MQSLNSSFVVGTIAGALGVSAVALKFFLLPYFWIGLTAAATVFLIAVRTPEWARLPLVIAGSVPLALALGELMFASVSRIDVDRKNVPPPFQADALLGWSLRPSHVSHASARAGAELMYDVTYSTGPDGHRIAPPHRADRIDGCLLFFADSFTFGEGVGDHDPFPFRLGLKLQGRFRVVNFAVPGHGAEQMLALMQQGKLSENPPCEPTHIFYSALPDHVLRAAGKIEFARTSPRYRLGPNGIPEYLATKSFRTEDVPESDSGRRPWLTRQLSKSRIYRTLAARPPRPTEADRKLYFAIVREAFRLFAGRWPTAKLDIISWDIFLDDADSRDRFHRGLQATGARVHFIDDILPGYTNDPEKYGLHRLDFHPNPRAHELVAAYLAQRVLLSRNP